MTNSHGSKSSRMNCGSVKNFMNQHQEGIRVGDWKFRVGSKHPRSRDPEEKKRVEQLFNLAEDVGETRNLIEQYPERAEQLKEKKKQVSQNLWNEWNRLYNKK